MSRCSSSASTAPLSPWTTLKTPSGRPASFSSSASSTRADGSRSDGLRMKRVAAGDRDREHPHRHHRGKVERRDAGDDAERLAERVAVDAGADVLGEFALEQVRDAAGELDDLDAALHLALGVGEHLAVLGRDDGRQRIETLLQDMQELVEHARAPQRRRRRPSRRRGSCVLDRFPHFGSRSEIHMGGDRPGRRIENGNLMTAFSGDDPAADEMRNDFHHEILQGASRSATEP